jgi:hypothetical protein
MKIKIQNLLNASHYIENKYCPGRQEINTISLHLELLSRLSDIFW